jgi:hypothetical protein
MSKMLAERPVAHCSARSVTTAHHIPLLVNIRRGVVNAFHGVPGGESGGLGKPLT